MVRESGISATKPVFPAYLFPTFKFPFNRRRSSSSSSSGREASSPPSDGPLTKKRLSRVASNTLRCSTCSTDIAFSSQIISKGFTGRYGRAFLVAPPSLPAPQTLLNIRLGRSEDRQLVTGWHTVADITCGTCARKLGWKYVNAKEQAQKYKVGKYILEMERVVTHRAWEDVRDDKVMAVELDQPSDDNDVVFDSEDEDECEDVFAGTWDPEAVARRRNRLSARRESVQTERAAN